MSTDPDRPTGPEELLGYLLKHAMQRLTAMTDAALQPFGIDSKDLGALHVLRHREATSQLAVAQTLGIDRTTMVALLDDLEAHGVVARRPDPADRRRNVVELTKSGIATYDAARAAYASAEAAFLAGLDPAAADQLRVSLRTLLRD